MKQILKSDNMRHRPIRRQEIKEVSTESISSDYYWYWNSSDNPYDENNVSKWAPYDIYTSNFLKIIISMENGISK